MTLPAIELCRVVKRFGSTIAVNGVSLRVEQGEVFAFLGPNGAGKTTTIKLAVGLLRAQEGSVSVCGQDMGRDGLAAKRRLAYVPDQPFLYDKLTGREFLYFVAKMYAVTDNQRDERLRQLSSRLQMDDFLDQMTEGYSHGMKQKVVLASAFLHRPEVLLIDEPMVGLDPRTVRVVKDLFIEHARGGGTVFLSTHTLDVAQAVADRIGIIHRGQLVALGTMPELRAQADRQSNLEDVFLTLTQEQDAPIS